MLRRMWECALLSTLLASPALAETGAWEAVGPDGGNISAVAIDPDDAERIFALSNETAFRRERRDRGFTALEGRFYDEIAVGAGGRVYLVGGGMARSDDHGHHFETLRLPDETYGSAVAAAPSDADVVYVATLTGVYRSPDGGRTFAARGSGLPVGESALALAVDPDDVDTVYAAVRNAGVFVSQDGAATWSSITNGLPCPTAEPYRDGCVISLRLTAADPPALLVGVASGGLMRSVDQGATWQAAEGAIVDQYVTAIASPRSAPSDVAPVVYAGVASDDGYSSGETPTRFQVLASFDGGASWTVASDNPLPAAVAALALSDDGILYAGTGVRSWAGLGYQDGAGLYRSDDEGRTWALDQRGMYGTCLTEIVAAPASRTALHAVPYYDVTRLYSSVSGGDGWRRTVRPGAFTVGFDVDPNDPNHLYALSGDGQLSASRDGGVEWTSVSTSPSTTRYPADLAIDGRDGDTLYTIVTDDSVHYAVEKSVDAGATWRATLSVTSSAVTWKVVVDPASDTVYAAFTDQLYRSRDAGETWTQLLTFAPGEDGIYDLTVAPTSPPTLVRSGPSGVLVSEDDGATWQRPRFAGSNDAFFTSAVTVDPGRAVTLYAIAGRRSDGAQIGLYRSDDGGRDWRRIGEEPAVGYQVSGLAVDPHDRLSVYAATCGGGVQRFTQSATAADSSGGNGCAVGPSGVSAVMLAAHGAAIGLLGWLRAWR
ncbi:MAG: hypothetical protein SF182_02805 [Deltaproteobacteria bacterium]|nr:hypothetical protein [Deltaproteobacteria bacterium]